ncbi:MAG: hypothetical protein ACREFU_15220, partial [Acetobacteraceae bacterium]
WVPVIAAQIPRARLRRRRLAVPPVPDPWLIGYPLPVTSALQHQGADHEQARELGLLREVA